MTFDLKEQNKTEWLLRQTHSQASMSGMIEASTERIDVVHNEWNVVKKAF